MAKHWPHHPGEQGAISHVGPDPYEAEVVRLEQDRVRGLHALCA